MLGAIVSIELIRAGFAWFAIAGGRVHLAAIFVSLFSAAVISSVALLIRFVFVPAERALMAHMETARNARERLARSEAWYRSIFDRHPNPAVALDRDARYLRVNAAMERLSGFC